MLEIQGQSIIFYAHYTTSGVSETGLTVTIDVYEVTRDGTKTQVVTNGACTEIGDGLYRYLLAAGSVDAAAEYVAVFHTATDTVDAQDIPAMWVIDRANLEDIDDILTDTSTTLDTKLNTIDGIVDDIKERTDNLPDDPADDSDIDTQLAAIQADLDDPTQYKANVSGLATSAEIAALDTDSVLDAVVIGSYTMKEILTAMAAKMHGLATGGGSTTIKYTGLDGTPDVIVETVDEDGNRSNVVLTL